MNNKGKTKSESLKIPNNFESLLKVHDLNAINTLLKPSKDLIEFHKIAYEINQTAQGKIIFLRGDPGSGKSTFPYCLTKFLSEFYTIGISVPEPYKVSLSEIPRYLSENIKDEEKISIITIDNRESQNDNDKDLSDLFMNLKTLMREKRVLIIWPVVQADFATKSVEILRKMGGNRTLAHQPIIQFQGLESTEYRVVLEEMLKLEAFTLDDYGISDEEITRLLNSNLTIGDFLNEINYLIIETLNFKPLGDDFGRLIFIMSSSSKDLLNYAREVRRSTDFYLDAKRLLMNTSSSKTGRWWAERENDPQTKLAYIIQRFDANFVTLSPSAVVSACGMYGEPDLKECTKDLHIIKSNAQKAMLATELYKIMNDGKDDSTRKGQKTTDKVLACYENIQSLSEKRHKSINTAIMKLLKECSVQNYDIEYEVSKNNLLTDVTLKNAEDIVQLLEFHHKKGTEYNQNKISLYILEKLKEYAINYGLVKS